jgi:hypothetical protein
MIKIISESLRALSNVIAYNIERDRCYILMGQALKSIEDNKLLAAKGFLQQAKGSVDQKFMSTVYIKNSEYTKMIKDLKSFYEGAIQAVQKNDSASAKGFLEQSLKALKDAEKFIK